MDALLDGFAQGVCLNVLQPVLLLVCRTVQISASNVSSICVKGGAPSESDQEPPSMICLTST